MICPAAPREEQGTNHATSDEDDKSVCLVRRRGEGGVSTWLANFHKWRETRHYGVCVCVGKLSALRVLVPARVGAMLYAGAERDRPIAKYKEQPRNMCRKLSSSAWLNKANAGTPTAGRPQAAYRAPPPPRARCPRPSPCAMRAHTPPVENPGNVVPARHGQVVGVDGVAGDMKRAAAVGCSERSSRRFPAPAAAAAPRAAADRR